MANLNTQELTELVKNILDVLDTKEACAKEAAPADGNYVRGKVIIITGSGSGFGMKTAEIAAGMGAKVVLADVSEERLIEAVKEIKAVNGGDVIYQVADVTDYAQMEALANKAVATYGAIDVMVNNAGIMPLASFSNHKDALKAWDKCIDINFRGVLYGICAVYDQMIKQGRGHIINISSVYGSFPVTGSGVYQATKSAVRFMTNSLRMENQGKIRTTIINPTGCADTKLFDSVVALEGLDGAIGLHKDKFYDRFNRLNDGKLTDAELDIESPEYWFFKKDDLANQIIHAINQPWGLEISDMTVRATGEDWIV